MNKTVVLADDHPALRVGLRRVLEDAGDFSVTGEVECAEALLETTERLKPDLVVMDLRISGVCAFDAIRAIRENVPQTAVMVFSSWDDAKHVRRALRAGAVGYLLKNGALDEIVRAIRLTADGQSYISPQISEHVVQAIIQEDETDTALAGLTQREREVLRLVAEGYSSRQIAGELGVSPKTIETHRARMMSKLGIHKSSKLVRFAIEAGVLEG